MKKWKVDSDRKWGLVSHCPQYLVRIHLSSSSQDLQNGERKQVLFSLDDLLRFRHVYPENFIGVMPMSLEHESF
jgi:hypothetical protein